MQHGLIGPDSPDWSAVLLAGDHDCYHLPGYVSLSARYEGGVPLAFFAEEAGRRLLVPLIVRPIGEGESATGAALADATCPYGYAGPLLTPAAGAGSEDFFRRAVDQLLEELRGRGIISCFLRLHPLLGLPLGPLRDRGHLVAHGETVWVDLTLSQEELWGQIHSHHRRQIQRAQRRGQRVHMDEWDAFPDFMDTYEENMRRVGADEYYFFPRDYFLGLREVLGERLHLGTVRFRGEVAAAILFTEVCGIVQYHLGGTRDAFVQESPTKFLIHHVCGWAKERGNRVLHLGGGVGCREDALFTFKARFSPRRSPFSTWRVVTDEPAYRALTSRWEARARARADEAEGYFPAYRKPVAV